MPKKKGGDADKPIPEILRTPMRYDWDFLVEVMLAEATGKRIDPRIMDRHIAQLTERIQAADREVGAPPSSDNTISERDLRLYIANFPNGFRAIPEGLNVKGPRKWTMDKKLDLVSFVNRRRECGVVVRDAVDEYFNLLEKPIGGVDNMVSRYHEFNRHLSSGDFTTQEKLEIAKWHLQQLSAQNTK